MEVVISNSDWDLCCILCIIPDISPVSPAKQQEVFIVALELQVLTAVFWTILLLCKKQISNVFKMPSAGKARQTGLISSFTFLKSSYSCLNAQFDTRNSSLILSEKNALSFWFYSLYFICDKCGGVTAASSDRGISCFSDLFRWKNWTLAAHIPFDSIFFKLV